MAEMVTEIEQMLDYARNATSRLIRKNGRLRGEQYNQLTDELVGIETSDLREHMEMTVLEDYERMVGWKWVGFNDVTSENPLQSILQDDSDNLTQ